MNLLRAHRDLSVCEHEFEISLFRKDTFTGLTMSDLSHKYKVNLIQCLCYPAFIVCSSVNLLRKELVILKKKIRTVSRISLSRTLFNVNLTVVYILPIQFLKFLRNLRLYRFRSLVIGVIMI